MYWVIVSVSPSASVSLASTGMSTVLFVKTVALSLTATGGALNLGDSAVVNGNINVQSVVVRGKINGNITAKEKIEIKSKTELFGDIRAAKLIVEEGVTFVGKTEVNPNKSTPTPPPTRPGETPKTPEIAKLGGR